MKIIQILFGRALPLIVAAVALTASAQDERRVGVWELNLSKSRFSPGPPPRKQILTYRPAGPQWMALLQGIDASGRPINPDMNNLAIIFDGKDHPTATVDYDTTAWKLIDSNTYSIIRKKAGKVVQTSMNVVSEDGATMTITTKGVTADGQEIDNVAVYEKR